MDFVSEDDDLSPYPFVIAPAYQLVSEAVVRKWRAYVEGGGHLVLTCRTGQKDPRGQLPEGPWAGSIAGLIGARVRAFDTLPEGVAARFAAVGRPTRGRRGRPSRPRARDESPRRVRGPVLRRDRRRGDTPSRKGSVTYVGVETASGDLERELVRDVYRRAGVAIEDLPAAPTSSGGTACASA